MLRVRGKQQRQATCPSWMLLVFSVGGRRLAVKTSEVAGISQWNSPIPVGSRTPFIMAVVRQGQTVLPVFDLAAALRLCVEGSNPLCLRIKHPLGDMVMCIDEEMPTLQTLEPAAIRTYREKDVPAEGSYTSGLDEIPILSIAQLGSYME
jgi:chemotaxis signal transduction protein